MTDAEVLRMGFGPFVTFLRERAGLSKWMLSRRMTLDRTYLLRLEAGTRLPTRRAVADVGKALQVSEADRIRLYVLAGFIPPDREDVVLVALQREVAA